MKLIKQLNSILDSEIVYRLINILLGISIIIHLLRNEYLPAIFVLLLMYFFTTGRKIIEIKVVKKDSDQAAG